MIYAYRKFLKTSLDTSRFFRLLNVDERPAANIHLKRIFNGQPPRLKNIFSQALFPDFCRLGIGKGEKSGVEALPLLLLSMTTRRHIKILRISAESD